MGQQKVKKDIIKEEAIKKTKPEVKEEKVEPKQPKLEEKSAKKAKKARVRGKKWQVARKQIENKAFPAQEAIELVKKVAFGKFENSLEVHINFAKNKKSKEPIRGIIQLPAGTGKKLNIAILDDKLAEEIAATKKTPFNILLAKIDEKQKLSKISKILGPKGLMPSEKAGTLVADPKKSLEEFNKGKISYKTDQFGILHQVIGKLSWENSKLLENFQALMAVLPKNQIKSIYLSASMSPAVRVEL